MDKEYYTNVPWNVINCSSKAELNPYMDSNNNNQYCSPSQPTSSLLSNDAFALRKLIGKLGGGGDISDATRFNPPLSPPKLYFPVLDHVSNMGSLGNSLPPVACDPGFAERAAKFSCLGSRSFNGRATQQSGLINAELSNDLVKLQRVSSSPVLKRVGSSLEMKNITQLQTENRILLKSENELSHNLPASVASWNEESMTNDEMNSNSKKRKAISRAAVKSSKENSAKRDDDGVITKRSKQTEDRLGPTNDVKTGSDDGSDQRKQKSDDTKKPSEPPKDYIHVRARRGQATDSHSLAERVRREKISERMKLLQDLVPGCNKVTGKALMLDEIINYVQSLQRQVEFLSMKLASVNPGMDGFQENGTLHHELYPVVDDASSPAFYHHHHQLNVQQQPLDSNANITVDPMGILFPSLNGFIEFPAFGEDDLHSIVHMGFAHNPVDFPVPDHTTEVKIEL